MDGILLVDKPEGLTSNEVVQLVKRRVKPAKVGHTGTLDPAASGLIVILVGSCTRALDYLDESRKCYHLTVLLGEETDTDDREGQVVRQEDPSGVTEEQIMEVLKAYRGVFDQTPPRFSAIKKNGVPLYKLARKGVEVEPTPRKVEVFALELTKWDKPVLELDLICSKGTYARALARDIGRDLKVGGRLDGLRRTASGGFHVDDSMTVDEVSLGGRDAIRERLIDLPTALGHIPDVQVFPQEIRRLVKGSPVSIARSRLPEHPGNAGLGHAHLYKVVSGDGSLIILVRPRPRGSNIEIAPAKVFKSWRGD